MKKSNGEGSIYYHEKRKRWVAQFTTEDKKRKTFYGKTKKDAREKMLKAQMELMAGTYLEPSKITVATLMQDLIDEDKELNLIKDSTYLRKSATAKRIKESSLGSKAIQNVTEADLRAFLKTITTYSESVIKKDWQLLNRTMTQAVVKDIIVKNPMLGIRCPKSTQNREKVRALTLDEHKKLLEVLNKNDILYSFQMRLMLLTGMRMGEINALSVNDVNMTFNQITVRRTLTRDEYDRFVIGHTTKTYAGQRKLPITESVKKLLALYFDTEYKENKEDLLFWDSKSDKVVSTTQVNLELRRVLKKYNIVDESQSGKISLHSLRHSYATRCIEAGMQAKVLQRLLGHTDVTLTLNTYCDAFDEFKEENIAKVEQYMKDKNIV